MYNIGEIIVYGGNGVCKVEDISFRKSPFSDKKEQYYTLSPIYGNGKIFIPVDTKMYMRKAMDRQQAYELIDSIPSLEIRDLENVNMKYAAEYYQSFMSTHEYEDLATLIKTIHVKNADAQQNGKRMGSTDGNFIRKAEDILYGELANALGIEQSEVKAFIADRLEKLPQES